MGQIMMRGMVYGLLATMALLASLFFLSSRSIENQMSLSISGRTGFQPVSSMGRGVACHAAGKGKPYNVQVVVGNDPEPVAIKKFTARFNKVVSLSKLNAVVSMNLKLK